MTIEEKYKIKYIGSKRVYKADLSTREFDFEFSSPYSIKVGTYYHKVGSYNNMIYSLAKYLNELSPKSKEELLNIKNDWGKQDVFSEVQKSNYKEFDCGLFINVNHTSVHALWTIQLLLKKWNVDLSTCELYIHRMPKGEKREVLDYYEEKTIKDFKEYVRFTHSYSQEEINFIAQKLIAINQKICPKLYVKKGYDNILVLDDYYVFSKMRDEIIEQLKRILINKPKNLKNYRISLNLLDDFYKQRLK